MLARLKEIRGMKVQKCERRFKEARYQQRLASEALDHAQQTLQDYIVWREKKETLMFAEAYDQTLKKAELDEFREKIGVMRSKDAVYQKSILEAEQRLDQAKENTELHYSLLTRAQKKHEKFTQLVEEDLKKSKLESEREEEGVIEELIAAGNGRR